MGDDGRDWTEHLERCARCGSDLPMDEWRPVATVTTDDGAARIEAFCDESCKDARVDDEDEGESTE